jgi:flavin reductase (DIM6/NTAB) family NADH-FMN oxidoreductase RutF
MAPSRPGRSDAAELTAAFKGAMRRLASTVTIVSTAHDGRRYGMAATAVSSVTAAPPAILACVNRSASIHAALNVGARYCINLLGPAHAGIVGAFSGQVAGEDRFARGDWRAGGGGQPYLADAAAAIFCRLALSTPYGSHSIVVGEVEAVLLGGDPEPLIYRDGGFHRTAPLAP